MRTDLRQFVTGLFEQSRFVELGIFDRQYLTRLLEQHVAGRVDHNYRLWLLINLEIWYRLNFEGRSVEAMRADIDRLMGADQVPASALADRCGMDGHPVRPAAGAARRKAEALQGDLAGPGRLSAVSVSSTPGSARRWNVSPDREPPRRSQLNRRGSGRVGDQHGLGERSQREQLALCAAPQR